MADAEQIHSVYMPFTADELERRFRLAAGGPAPHVRRFLRSAAAATADAAVSQDAKAAKHAHQIEKDETFWTAACLTALFCHGEREGTFEKLRELLTRAFGSPPPLPGTSSWEACFEGTVDLFLEVGLSSPASYRQWLRDRFRERNLAIPYTLAAPDRPGWKVEGTTKLDALLVADSGFAVHFEAKVRSDTSCQIEYDCLRNQLARNIDAMLESPRGAARPPLDRRDPAKSLFVLLTPRLFKNAPTSRLYGWLMRDYMSDPAALARDLPHRNADWSSVSRRLGWVTWEDCNELLPDACGWLTDRENGQV